MEQGQQYTQQHNGIHSAVKYLIINENGRVWSSVNHFCTHHLVLSFYSKNLKVGIHQKTTQTHSKVTHVLRIIIIKTEQNELTTTLARSSSVITVKANNADEDLAACPDWNWKGGAKMSKTFYGAPLLALDDLGPGLRPKLYRKIMSNSL